MDDDIIDDLDMGDVAVDSGNDLGFDSFGDYGGDSNMSKHSDLLKELTNFDPIIQRRIRNWLGLEYDEEVKGYVQKKEAIINERGAKWAIGVLETYQAKPNIITNLDRDEYKTFKIEIIESCWLVFGSKFDEFEVKDAADQHRLSQELQHSAFLVLAGAGDGKYSKFLGESVHRTESVSMTPQNQPMYNVVQPMENKKQGMFSNLKNTLLGK